MIIPRVFLACPHNLQHRTVWPTEWSQAELCYIPGVPDAIVTQGVASFVVWLYRDLMGPVREFAFRRRPWQFWRPSIEDALRHAIGYAESLERTLARNMAKQIEREHTEYSSAKEEVERSLELL